MKKMELNELRKLFGKFSLNSLESIDVLLGECDEYEKAIFSNVYREKFEESRDEHEGINEYDYLCKIANFDLKEIKENIDIFTDKELRYIQKLLNNAPEYENLKLKVEEYMIIISSQLSSELSDTELYSFFNKFSIIDLAELSEIFSYVKDYDMSKINTIYNMVYKEKEKQCYGEFSIPVKSYNYSILNLASRKNEFSDKELILLHKIVENAYSFLSSIDTYSGLIDDFDIDDYPVESMGRLETILFNEINTRKGIHTKRYIKALTS